MHCLTLADALKARGADCHFISHEHLAHLLEGFTSQMQRLPAFLRESLTYDWGSKTACHAQLLECLKLDMRFAYPYVLWQRGGKENNNGLIRQFLPKGMDLSGLSQTYLNDIARLLNGRLRKALGWQTPDEVLSQEIA